MALFSREDHILFYITEVPSTPAISKSKYLNVITMQEAPYSLKVKENHPFCKDSNTLTDSI